MCLQKLNHFHEAVHELYLDFLFAEHIYIFFVKVMLEMVRIKL